MFFNCDIARLNFTHTDHAALACRSIEPPFIKASSYASVVDNLLFLHDNYNTLGCAHEQKAHGQQWV
jgi:hypothetical protein